MPSRAYTSFLRRKPPSSTTILKMRVNALSGLYLISTVMPIDKKVALLTVVSMPSRAYTSFLHGFNRKGSDSVVPVSMPSRAYTSFLHVGDDGFKYLELDPSVNALSGLYLISTCR